MRLRNATDPAATARIQRHGGEVFDAIVQYRTYCGFIQAVRAFGGGGGREAVAANEKGIGPGGTGRIGGGMVLMQKAVKLTNLAPRLDR